IVMIEQKFVVTDETTNKGASWGETWRNFAFAMSRWWQITWTSLLGLIIGILPGAGASIAAFVAYQQSRLYSKNPEFYGKGHPDGVVAPESANNGVTTGTMVPLLAIGVPGGSTAAVMM